MTAGRLRVRDLDNELDFHRGIERQDRYADCAADVRARLAEDFSDDVRSAIDDARLSREPRFRRHITLSLIHISEPTRRS